MENPITAVRERAGLTRKEFALALGVSYAVLAAHEAGLPAAVAPQVRRGLAAMGLDADRLAREYAEWRRRAGEAVRGGGR